MVLSLRDLATAAAAAGNTSIGLAAYRSLLTLPPPKIGQPRQAWMRAANNALVLTHAQGVFDESARLADRVVQYVDENPYITHAAACSYAAVGRYDDALEQARLAVKLGYEYLDRLRVDTDLGLLLDRHDFQALFDTHDEEL
jgi:tetratricopeptide (TPR) repeat protein